MHSKKRLPLLLLVSLVLQPGMVQASPELLSFTLHYENSKTGLNYSGTTRETSFNSLALSWYEPFQEYFHAGLEVGGFEMIQRSNPLISAQFTKGEYAGVIFRFIPYDGDLLRLNFDVGYRYSRSIGETTSQQTEFNWHHRYASFDGILRLFPKNELVLTINERILKGDQVNRGTVNSSIDFAESQSRGYAMSWQFFNRSRGKVSLTLSDGYQQSTSIRFSQGF